MSQIDRGEGLTGTLGVKAPCAAATTASVTLQGEQTIDGVAVVAGDRVLVKNQSTASQNGIYVCQTSDWYRAPDFDGNRDIVTGTQVSVSSGTVSAGAVYKVSTSGTITVGTTSISFTLVSTPADLAAAQAAASAAAASAAAASASAVDAQNFAKIEWQGAWSGATAYVAHDAVSCNGSSYVCILAHTNQAPPSATYWDVLAQQGAAGAGSGDLLAANNLSDVADAATARTNLGAMSSANDTVTFAQINSGSKASQAEAEAGTEASKLMTPLRVAQAIAALGSGFASGTRMLFLQGTAPTGWTRDDTAAINDSVLRLRTGSSIGSGGSLAFSTWAAQTTDGATTLSTAQIPSHTHTVRTNSSGMTSGYVSTITPITVDNSSNASTGDYTSVATGGGGSHTHSLSQNLKYYEAIIAQKA